YSHWRLLAPGTAGMAQATKSSGCSRSAWNRVLTSVAPGMGKGSGQCSRNGAQQAGWKSVMGAHCAFWWRGFVGRSALFRPPIAVCTDAPPGGQRVALTPVPADGPEPWGGRRVSGPRMGDCTDARSGGRRVALTTLHADAHEP